MNVESHSINCCNAEVTFASVQRELVKFSHQADKPAGVTQLLESFQTVFSDLIGQIHLATTSDGLDQNATAMTICSLFLLYSAADEILSKSRTIDCQTESRERLCS